MTGTTSIVSRTTLSVFMTRTSENLHQTSHPTYGAGLDVKQIVAAAEIDLTKLVGMGMDKMIEPLDIRGSKESLTHTWTVLGFMASSRGRESSRTTEFPAIHAVVGPKVIRNVGEEKCTDIQHAFDTARDYDKIPANPGYIEPVLPSQEWAIALSPEDILTRHRSQHVPQYAAKPIIILDARTANDGSVLVVAPVLNDETGALDFKAIRFDAARVPAAALNIQIGNQSLNDLEQHLDDDGIWRRFKSRDELVGSEEGQGAA
ncbi:uncharacterized protein STEHIDRAFT_107355 [Stereum hirsutum FP-91666 SS1]|uniref:uncharacterized protein n=1 Tax=Stereum hirsutum (strain FP-91666) TaxID=721885 RepID=UPI000440BD00|nr:uncharacterized protein STEHIDRAFT_107355 [Stereum hirsutum FP-91666 SS1]EIM90575.1 hypothetical protein STEHIDRAFT_107355 [Stereum hirsutum FP-91666 SS1]